MLLLANGDSFTYGHGLSALGTKPRNWPGRKSNHVDRNCRYALENGWPALLSKQLGYDLANISREGSSNDRMVRTTLQYLAKHGHRDTLVIIGWSQPSRREVHIDSEITETPLHTGEQITGYKSFLVNQNDIVNSPLGRDPLLIRWAKNYTRYGWDETESYMRYYSQILLLSAYLDQNEIPYLYFNTIHNTHAWQTRQKGYTKQMTQKLHDQIDWRSFAADTDKICVMDRFHDQLDETDHLTQQGHASLADLLFTELTNRKIIGT